jgi:hypothetical protein
MRIGQLDTVPSMLAAAWKLKNLSKLVLGTSLIFCAAGNEGQGASKLVGFRVVGVPPFNALEVRQT